MLQRLVFTVPKTQLHRQLSLTPEFKSRFHFPYERFAQILDGTYPKGSGWVGQWKAFLQQFHKLRIEQIGGLLHVCAKKHAIPLDLWKKLQTVHWTRQLDEAKGNHLASLLYSLALLNESRQLKGGRIKLEPFFDGVLKQTLQRKDLSGFTNATVAQCIESFALLKLNDHPLVTMYSAEISRLQRLKDITIQIASKVLWSWAQLQYINPSQLALLSASAVAHKEKASLQELVNVFWSWGILRYRYRTHWSKLLEELRKRRNGLTGEMLSTVFIACMCVSFRDENCGPLLQHMVATKKLVFFNTVVICDIIWCLGYQGFQDDDENVCAFVNEGLKISRLKAASEHDLLHLALGLSDLDHQNSDHWSALHNEITKIGRSKAFTAEEICDLIWAFGKVSRRVGDHLTQDLKAELLRRKRSFHQLSCHSLCRVMVGWAHTESSADGRSETVAREVVKEDRLQQYSPQQFAHLCWSFGKLGINSNALFTYVETQLLHGKILSDLTDRQISLMLIGWNHSKFYNAIVVNTIQRHLRDRSNNQNNRHQTSDIN